MTSDWYEEMEKAEQEYDAREYELAQEYSRGYQQGRADAIDEIATRLEEELTMVMPRDKVKYVMYKVHTVLEQLKEKK